MLVAVVGGLGSGKTLLLAILANFSKKQVIANFKIDIPHYKPLDIYKFIKSEYNNVMICLDEAYIYLESRMSSSKQNQLLSYVIFQSRKKTIDLSITAQLASSLDLRFRHLVDYVIRCEQIRDGFKYSMFLPENPNISTSTILPYLEASKFFNLYNTNEVITPNHVNQFEYLTPQEKMKKIEEVGVKATQDLNEKGIENITKAIVRNWLREQNLDIQMGRELYDYLKTYY